VSVVRLSAVNVSYRVAQRLILDDICLKLESRQSLAVSGPSGAGKTTLLHVLAGVLIPSQGEVLLDDQPIRAKSECASRIGLVLQNIGLIPDLTVVENIALPLQARRLPKRVFADRTEAALDAVGLSSLASRFASQLSGGQQQRVGVARALAGDPEVVIADEPTSELDAENRALVLRLLRGEMLRRKIVVVDPMTPMLWRPVTASWRSRAAAQERVATSLCQPISGTCPSASRRSITGGRSLSPRQVYRPWRCQTQPPTSGLGMSRLKAVALLLGLLLTACGSTSGSATPAPSPSPPPSANPMPGAAYEVSGGCGATQLYKGGFPEWISTGVQGLTGMGDSMYAIASPPTAVGFLLEYPLKAKTPTGSPLETDVARWPSSQWVGTQHRSAPNQQFVAPCTRIAAGQCWPWRNLS